MAIRAYISFSFNRRLLIKNEISTIVNTLNENFISAIVFVDKYRFELSQEREMMQKAFEEIDNCDILIAETSEKGIGIGVEVGYAKGKSKTVIYLRQKDTEHSTTVAGSSDFQIIYSDTIDLRMRLLELLPTLVSLKAPHNK